MINKNKKISYMKQNLIDQVKKLSEEKKDRLGVTTIHFEDEDVSNLDGVVRVGYYVYRIKETEACNFTYWDDIPAKILVKMKDRLINNRFYAEKRVEGAAVKVRLKTKK